MGDNFVGGVPVAPLGNGPFVFDTAEQHKIRVSVVTKGLEHPWSLVFLPDGSMLVTEHPGRLRLIHDVIRDGKLDPKPITGVPAVRLIGLSRPPMIVLRTRSTSG